MKEQEEKILKEALGGNIHAFQQLFSTFQNPLKSYLYRLLASRSDADDLTHDTFIRAYDKLHLYRGESSLKTWVFQIATNLACNLLKSRKRWTPDVSEQAKHLVMQQPALAQAIEKVATYSESARYDIREHIDTCFTCISKNLPVENQVALILKDVYDFTVPDIILILGKSEGTVKYLIQHARKTLMDIFDQRCALIRKEGVCHQCSELNGWLNPRQNQQEALMEIDMVKSSGKYPREELYRMRAALIKHIDPLRSEGNELQEILLKCNRIVMGEEAMPG
ncbi:MAG: RNA polymerase sigma factor [Bacteroidetes bacterium]|nr:MAG: RNA polymerase sigma factor [Bacteroidota bacterium]